MTSFCVTDGKSVSNFIATISIPHFMYFFKSHVLGSVPYWFGVYARGRPGVTRVAFRAVVGHSGASQANLRVPHPLQASRS